MSEHESDRLTNPPNGGKLRQWEALGMSRASWYRHGKPTEKPTRPFSQARIARHDHVSIRTVQRVERVMRADPDLWRAAMDQKWGGYGLWGTAEWLILHPDAHRKWREENGLPWPVPELKDD